MSKKCYEKLIKKALVGKTYLNLPLFTSSTQRRDLRKGSLRIQHQ